MSVLIKKKIMKKVNLVLMSCMIIVFISSCSDSHDDACHECHIALENADGSETMWEMQNSSGGEDFCGEELTTVEAPGYDHSVSEILISTVGNDTLQPGDYGASNGYEIHCEDHGDHDAHDH